MVRLALVLLCVLSVVALGLQPVVAQPRHMMEPSAAAAHMQMDCACPPDHGGPVPGDSNSCPPTLACMIDCSVVSTVATTEFMSSFEVPSVQGAVFAEIVAPPSSASDPPFRPPSL